MDIKAKTYYSSYTEIRDVEIGANVQAWIVFGCTLPNSKSFMIEFYKGAKRGNTTNLESGSSLNTNTGTT